jgi:hypothetical protein
VALARAYSPGDRRSIIKFFVRNHPSRSRSRASRHQPVWILGDVRPAEGIIQRLRNQEHSCRDDERAGDACDALTSRHQTFEGDGCRPTTIARRSMTPTASRIAVRPAQQQVQ